MPRCLAAWGMGYFLAMLSRCHKGKPNLGRAHASAPIALFLGLGEHGPAQTRRPLVTEEVETRADGTLEVQLAAEVRDDFHSPASSLRGRLVRAPVVGVNLGLGDRAELQLRAPLRQFFGPRAAEPRRTPAEPKSTGEAFEILGINPDASRTVVKKIVDGLRQSWHPDHARDDTDRRLREDRMKQINIAWDLINANREAVAGKLSCKSLRLVPVPTCDCQGHRPRRESLGNQRAKHSITAKDDDALHGSCSLGLSARATYRIVDSLSPDEELSPQVVVFPAHRVPQRFVVR